MRTSLSLIICALCVLVVQTAEAKTSTVNINLQLSNFVTRPSARSVHAAALRQRQNLENRATRSTVASTEQLYENGDLSFRIRYPEDWTGSDLMETTGHITVVALFLSPLEGDTDTSRENINVVAEDMTQSGLNFSDYTAAAVRNEQSIFTDFTLSSSFDTVLAGSPAHTIIFTAGFQGKPLKFEQIWTMHRGKMFVWTLAANNETFDRYTATLHDMLGTLAFGD